MLEYWMQNGRVALSSINYDNMLNKGVFKTLLNPIFQNDNKNTSLSQALFSSILPNIKKGEEKNLLGLSDCFYKITNKPGNSKISCIYCGKKGFVDLASYIYPFVTHYDRYPNVYSRGKIKSLKLCKECLLVSFAAFNKILFKSNKKNKSNQISMILFFSYDDEVLKRFYNGFIQLLLKTTFQTNIDVAGLIDKNDSDYNQFSYGSLWYPEDILSVIIDYISTKINDLEDLGEDVGSLLFSFNRTPSGQNYINIYDSFDVIDTIYPFVKGFNQFKKLTKNPDSFTILFNNLLINDKRESDFIFRRKILRNLLLYKRFDWKTIENIIMLKASAGKNIPYVKSFILVMHDIFSLDVETFKGASDVGYSLGIKIKDKEGNPNRLKKFIFDLRRTRNPQDFLYIVNLMQARASTSVFSDSLYDENNFEIIKVGFLIGYSNAIFQSKSPK